VQSVAPLPNVSLVDFYEKSQGMFLGRHYFILIIAAALPCPLSFAQSCAETLSAVGVPENAIAVAVDLSALFHKAKTQYRQLHGLLMRDYQRKLELLWAKLTVSQSNVSRETLEKTLQSSNSSEGDPSVKATLPNGDVVVGFGVGDEKGRLSLARENRGATMSAKLLCRLPGIRYSPVLFCQAVHPNFFKLISVSSTGGRP
jgi:hypothetical protein